MKRAEITGNAQKGIGKCLSMVILYIGRHQSAANNETYKVLYRALLSCLYQYSHLPSLMTICFEFMIASVVWSSVIA
jgi:hypothetical protein